MVAAVMGRPLLPEQPPWEMHVVEGLAGGMVGLIAKVHHSVIDGVAGAQLLAQLLDLTPEGSAVTNALPALVAGRAALPARVGRRRTARASSTARHAPCVRPARWAGPRCASRAAPSTRAPVPSPSRSVRRRSSSRRSAPAARSASPSWTSRGAAPEGTLRLHHQRRRAGRLLGGVAIHLAAHGQDADSPLVAVVPVSVRPDEADATGNQLSAMFVTLANDRKTPLERLRTVTEASASSKGQERAVGYGPLAHPDGRGDPARAGQAHDPVRACVRGSCARCAPATS